MKIAERKSHGEIGAQTQKTQVALLTLWHFDTFTSEKRKVEGERNYSRPIRSFIFPQAFVPYRQQSGIVSYISLKRDMGMVKLKRFDSK